MAKKGKKNLNFFLPSHFGQRSIEIDEIYTFPGTLINPGEEEALFLFLNLIAPQKGILLCCSISHFFRRGS